MFVYKLKVPGNVCVQAEGPGNVCVQAEAENFSTDPVPCPKNPMKTKIKWSY